MRPDFVSAAVKEKIWENRAWLKKLTEPKLRALACQHGVRKWATLSLKTLVTQLSGNLDIQKPVKV